MIKNIECCTSRSALVKYNVSEWKTCPEFSITHQIKYELCLEKTHSMPKAVLVLLTWKHHTIQVSIVTHAKLILLPRNSVSWPGLVE